MTPQAYLRGMVTYAMNLLSQVPLSLDIPGPSALDFASSQGLDSIVPYVPLSSAPSCPIDGPMSCHNSTPAADGCCFVYPSGRILLTQFWDREVHAGGAEEDWTIHGLWPDLCDGSYDSYCSLTPKISNITETLERHGQTELLAFMDRFWVASRGTNSHLWAHEYNKHGTCINTLAPSCYGDGYESGVEVVDYFARTAQVFRLLDTFTALQHANIVPSKTAHYPLVDIVAALEQFSGGRVVVRCSGSRRDTVHEVWYVFHIQGSLQSGEFVPAQDLGPKGDAGNCVPWVRYPPKVPKGDRVSRRQSR